MQQGCWCHDTCLEDSRRTSKKQTNQWQLVTMQPRIASDGHGEMHAIDRMEMCEKNVNECERVHKV